MTVDQLTELFRAHSGIAAFLGAFLWGNSVTFLFATLAGQQGLPLGPVMFFAFLGNALRDVLFFALGRSRSVEWLVSHRRSVRAYEKIKALQSRYRHRDWIVFIVVKFVYGLRFATLLYFGSIKYVWRRFLLYNGWAVIAITIVITGSGWLVGQGVSFIDDALQNLKAIGLAAIVAFAVYFLGRGIVRVLIGPKGNDAEDAPPEGGAKAGAEEGGDSSPGH